MCCNRKTRWLKYVVRLTNNFIWPIAGLTGCLHRHRQRYTLYFLIHERYVLLVKHAAFFVFLNFADDGRNIDVLVFVWKLVVLPKANPTLRKLHGAMVANDNDVVFLWVVLLQHSLDKLLVNIAAKTTLCSDDNKKLFIKNDLGLITLLAAKTKQTIHPELCIYMPQLVEKLRRLKHLVFCLRYAHASDALKHAR